MKPSYIFVTILLVALILVAGCSSSESTRLSTGNGHTSLGEPARFNYSQDRVVCYAWTTGISCVKMDGGT